jgi:iron(III) transport system permease protein
MTAARPAVVCGWLALLAATGFLVLFLVLPVGLTVWQGVMPSALYAALAHPVYREGLVNSLAIALAATALAALIAVPLAWIAARYRFRGKGLCEALLLAPIILPPFVGALGVAQLFGQYGMVNAALAAVGLVAPGGGPDWLGEHRFAAVCVLEALHLYPILYLNAVAGLSRLDPTLLEAAQGLGASPWTRLTRVVLPLVRPGLFAGGIVVFVWSFTELGTPLLLGYDRATPVQIFNGLNELLGGNPIPFALVVIMLAIATTLYLVARFVFLRRHDALVTKHAAVAAPVTLAGWRAWLPPLAFLAVVALAAAPHAAVVLIAVTRDWYGTVLPSGPTLAHLGGALAHPAVVPGVVNSVIYAGGATVLALVLGTFIAWTSARWRPFGWQALDALAMLPLAVPGVIMAFGFVTLCYALKIAGFATLYALLDPLSNPTLILIIAYAVRRLPHVLRAVAAGLAQVPVVYEEAAAALGAGLWCRLRRITLPLVAGSLAAGALLTFSFSILEVSDSLILAQSREFFPVTRVLFDLVNILGPGPSLACAFAVWAMLFLASSLALAAAILGKNVSQLFRD